MEYCLVNLKPIPSELQEMLKHSSGYKIQIYVLYKKNLSHLNSSANTHCVSFQAA